MAINTSVLTVVVGMTGIVLGTLLSPFLNHQLSQRYARKETLFKRKLEYFEKLTLIIEENISMYEKGIKEIEASFKKTTAKKITERFKDQRRKFKIMSSPLYFNIKAITQRIMRFVSIEKDIFSEFENLRQDKKRETLRKLDEKLKELEYFGNLAIFEMRRELMKK